ncbi:MAG: S10 family peptidase, partial [Phycisphaerales bacterium]|nr:S10 family peptidase [Phycisphaerales bacterium]
MGVIMDMLYWHAMVSPRVYSQWTSLNCDTASPSALAQCQGLYATALKSCGSFNQPLKQQLLLEERGKPVATSSRNGQINPDCLYYSFCVGNATLEFMEDTDVGCFSVENQITAYLNYPDVQAALHARPTKWRSCGGVVFDQIGGNHIVPFLEYFFTNAPTMRILYYSGDIDIKTVPFGETFRCLETLNRPVVDPWKPWGFNQEIAGYVEVYDTYTLATLKGAGHEAPAVCS